MIGFAYMEFNDKKKKKHVVNFPKMFVDKKYRSRGIATRLLNSLIEEIKLNHKHIVTIQLSVYESQFPAIQLYKKFGFEIFGEFDKEIYVEEKYYKQVAMELFLDE